MHRRRAFVLLLLAALPACRAPRSTTATVDGATAAAASTPSIAWQPWSEAAFAAARSDQRLVLLDLGAEWCHWCHVMERTTYADAGVRDVLARHFVAIAADADQRLDLAARYQDWGWPATIVFDATGRELWKNRGYVPPARMREVLQRLAADPQPFGDAGTMPPTSGTAPGSGLTVAATAELQDRLEALWDEQHAGFGFVHKYLDLAGAEWLLARARGGDTTARRRLLRWLDAERRLHDPVWGGAFQYSHGGVWTNPHFEKVMERQLADLRGYSLAFGAFGRDTDLAAARDVARFLLRMLRAPEGAFFASQDADLVPGQHGADYFALPDAERRARGLPRIERELWSRENGQAIAGLCALLATAPDPTLQTAATGAAEWIVAHRRRPDGTFAHGEHDVGGPFLADSLAMAGAAIALAEVTTEPRWLQLAVTTLHAIEGTFGDGVPTGFAVAVGDGILPPIVDRTENVQLARLANRVHHAAGDARCRRIAERAFAHVTAEVVRLAPGLPAALLLAADELATEPAHIVVVGDDDDPEAQALHAAALRAAPDHRVIEWIAPGAMTRRGETYPAGEHARAYVCRDGSCSAPIEQALALRLALGAVDAEAGTGDAPAASRSSR